MAVDGLGHLQRSEVSKLIVQQHPKKPEGDDGGAERKLIQAAALCCTFMIVELVGGYLSGSLAVMSDAAHLLSDLAGFGISIIAVRMGRRPGDITMTYGYARAEMIGALGSTMLIWILTAVLFFFAIKRFFEPEDVSGPIMLLLGVIGLIVNFVLGVVLGAESIFCKADCEDDDDSCADEKEQKTNGYNSTDGGPADPESCEAEEETSFWTRLTGGGTENVNVRAAYVHVFGDLLQNIGVIIAAAFIWAHPSWRFMDPICTILFTVLVVSTTLPVARDAVNVLMEGTPKGIDLGEVYDALVAIPNVAGVVDLHVWSLTLGQVAVSVHLNTPLADQHPVLKEAEKVLQGKFRISHTTIQVNCTVDDCCENPPK